VTAVGFYHLTRTGLDRALAPLLGRTLEAGERALVRCRDAAEVAALDAALWAVESVPWLPHGSAAAGDAALQPVWLTEADEVPNGARFLFRLDGAGALAPDRFLRVFDLFDGGNEARLAAARERWRAARAAGHAVTYWREGPGGWERG
jgi:DNA polymerase III subunit chi